MIQAAKLKQFYRFRQCSPLITFIMSSRPYQNQPDTNEGNFEQKLFDQRSTDEPIEKKRSRLLYQSRKRGS